MTPLEELFSKDADYASIFKSRPNIAMSPTDSPAPEISPSMNALVSSVVDDDGDGHWRALVAYISILISLCASE